MYIWKCQKCHHEWQSLSEKDCDWCGSKPKQIGMAYKDKLIIRYSDQDKEPEK